MMQISGQTILQTIINFPMRIYSIPAYTTQSSGPRFNRCSKLLTLIACIRKGGVMEDKNWKMRNLRFGASGLIDKTG